MGAPRSIRNEEQNPCLHGSSVEQDKEEAGFAHQVGKRPRKEPLFGGPPRTIETGSDFAIGLISSPRWEQDTERKRRPSNDRVAGNKTEKKTVSSTPRGTRLRSAALQTIESAAESEIGPRSGEPCSGVDRGRRFRFRKS